MMRRIERENTGLLKPGQDLVVAGCAGAAGAGILIEARRSELRQWFSEEYLDFARQELEGFEDPGWEFWSEFGAVEWEPAGEGGILAAIWNLSGAYETGVEFSLRQIPMLQPVIEICERFELNPYRLYSRGCCLLAAENGDHLVRSLEEKGMKAGVIGRVNRGIAREMLGAESRGFLERPQPDELRKVIPDCCL